MINYAIVEIAGKQYKILPNKELVVDFLGEKKNIEAQVLLLSDGQNLEIGTPYLQKKLNFEVLETVRGEKLRVAKYAAKSNYRRVIGFKGTYSKIINREK